MHIARTLVVSWLLASCSFAVAQESLPRLPNIVLVYADDLGYGDVGAQNEASRIPTPHLDRLANEGMRFTDAHSSSGICSPSRYALLTGRYHWRKLHGIVQAFGPSAFDAERLTLPEMLRERGYVTACIGKWHLGWDWDAIKKPGAVPDVPAGGNRKAFGAQAFDWTKPIPDGPLAHGFDHYFGDDVPNFPPYAWIEDDRIVEAPSVPYVPDPKPAEGAPEGRPGPMVKGWKQDAVMPTLEEHAVRWIDARRGDDRPFFLYFPWTSPHAPIVPTVAYQGKTQVGGYGDYVHQSDATMGAVLAALERNGFRDDTLVIFTADNGPEHYAYPRVRVTGHRSMGPLRGLKRDLYEGGHRVPFLVRWPGVVEPGSTCDALIGQIDVMRTLADILGIELPESAAEDGLSFGTLLRDARAEPPRRELVHNTHAGRYALRRDHWLLVDAPTGHHTKLPAWFRDRMGYGAEAKTPKLFDLSTDLGQRVDVALEHPEIVMSLRERLVALGCR